MANNNLSSWNAARLPRPDAVSSNAYHGRQSSSSATNLRVAISSAIMSMPVIFDGDNVSFDKNYLRPISTAHNVSRDFLESMANQRINLMVSATNEAVNSALRNYSNDEINPSLLRRALNLGVDREWILERARMAVRDRDESERRKEEERKREAEVRRRAYEEERKDALTKINEAIALLGDSSKGKGELYGILLLL
jgi:hypothetical protein